MTYILASLVPCNVIRHIRGGSVSCRSESDKAPLKVVSQIPFNRHCCFIIQPAGLVRKTVMLEVNKFFLRQRSRDEEHNTESYPVLWA